LPPIPARALQVHWFVCSKQAAPGSVQVLPLFGSVV